MKYDYFYFRNLFSLRELNDEDFYNLVDSFLIKENHLYIRILILKKEVDFYSEIKNI